MIEIICILALLAVCLALIAVCLFMLKIPLTATVIGAGVIIPVYIICKFLLIRDSARHEHEITLIRLQTDGYLIPGNTGISPDMRTDFRCITERRAA